jgi:hypothetical protein
MITNVEIRIEALKILRSCHQAISSGVIPSSVAEIIDVDVLKAEEELHGQEFQAKEIL